MHAVNKNEVETMVEQYKGCGERTVVIQNINLFYYIYTYTIISHFYYFV